MKPLLKKKVAPYIVCNPGKDGLLLWVMFFAIITLTIGSPAWSDDWLCVSWEKDDNCSVFYNGKITRTKNRVDVRTRKILTEELRQMDKDIANDVTHTEYLESYDCLSETCRILSLTTFRKDGDSHHIDLPNSRYSEIIPGSTHESIFKIVCKKDRKITKTKSKTKTKAKSKKKTK
jgi:hypothetical protein